MLSWTAPCSIENITFYRLDRFVSGTALAAGFAREVPGASARPLTEHGAVQLTLFENCIYHSPKVSTFFSTQLFKMIPCPRLDLLFISPSQIHGAALIYKAER